MSVYGVGHVLETREANSFGGFFFGIEVPDMNSHAFDSDAGSPAIPVHTMLGIGFFQVNASILRRSWGCLLGTILSVLGFRSESEITSSVIEMLSIDVIDQDRIPVLDSHDLSMEIDNFSGDSTSGAFIRTQTPSILIDPSSVGRIDKAVSTNASVACVQGDEGDILMAHQITPGVSPRVLAHCGGVLLGSIAVVERGYSVG